MSPEALAAVNTVIHELENLRLKDAAIGAMKERVEALLAKCDLLNASLHKQDREARTAEARVEGLERANRALVNENRQLRDDCEALRATAADWQRRAEGRRLS